MGAQLGELERRRVLTTAEAAKLIGVSAGHLSRLRYSGEGPAPTRIGSRRIGYLLGEVLDWLDRRTRRSRPKRKAGAR